MWAINIKKPIDKAKLQGTPIGPTSGKNINPSAVKITKINLKLDIIFWIILIIGDWEFFFLFKKSKKIATRIIVIPINNSFVSLMENKFTTKKYIW